MRLKGYEVMRLKGYKVIKLKGYKVMGDLVISIWYFLILFFILLVHHQIFKLSHYHITFLHSVHKPFFNFVENYGSYCQKYQNDYSAIN